MQKKIIRNISKEERFFEIINSMPSPIMNLYSGELFGTITSAVAEAINEKGIYLYRYVASSEEIREFESKFKALKKELNA